MDSFQITTLSMAFIILVIILIAVGVMMSSSNKNTSIPFPSYVHTCPDYWEVGGPSSSSSSSSAPGGSGGGHSVCILPTCNSGLNLGSLCNSAGSYDFADSSKHLQQNPVSGKVFIDPKDTLSSNPVPFCSLFDWASTYGVNWDGVSNTNQCT